MIEADHLLLVAGGHLDVVRIEELRDAGDDGHLALLGELREPGGELLDDRFLPATQLVDVEARLAVRHAEVADLLDLVDDPGDVEERLGRDAADVEADAAERRVPLDEHGLHAQVRRPERGAVPARARPDHEHRALDVHLPAVGRAGGGSGSGLTRSRRGRWFRRWSLRRPLGLRGALRRPGLLGRRFLGAGFRRLHHHDRRSLAHPIADLDPDLFHLSAHGRGNVHRRLVRLERDERILLLHLVPRLDEHLDDGDVLEIADIGDLHFLRRHAWTPMLRPSASATRAKPARAV